MTVLPRTGPSLCFRLLADGIPPTLLIDLLDPEGMRVGLASELLASDVALSPAPPLRFRAIRTA